MSRDSGRTADTVLDANAAVDPTDDAGSSSKIAPLVPHRSDTEPLTSPTPTRRPTPKPAPETLDAEGTKRGMTAAPEAPDVDATKVDLTRVPTKPDPDRTKKGITPAPPDGRDGGAKPPKPPPRDRNKSIIEDTLRTQAVPPRPRRDRAASVPPAIPKDAKPAKRKPTTPPQAATDEVADNAPTTVNRKITSGTSPGFDPIAQVPRKSERESRIGTSSDVFAVRGIRSPLVGRNEQIEQMLEVVAASFEFHAPQLITVIGNQGTGKSRLVDELIAKVGIPPVRVFTAQAVRDGPRLNVITRLLRDRFGIHEGDPKDKVLVQFRRQVQEVFGDEHISEVLHFLGRLLDLALPDSPFLRVLGENPRQHDEITRTVLRRFFEVDASKSPLILVIDDLQWADDDTLSLLHELGTGFGGSPIVLLASARSELLVRFSEWGQGVTDHLRIDLRNLEPDYAEEMLKNLLSRCNYVPEEIFDDAVEMTGGNPYFLEQLVRVFLANGTIDATGPVWRLDPARAFETELPISIEEAIEARIAALEEDERDVLEKGAVFGNVFWVGAVVALNRLEEDLTNERALEFPPALELLWGDNEVKRSRTFEIIAELVERDYLLQLDPEDSTVRGDIELVFKHNLERDLIARNTEAKRLARYHLLAAQWLETKLNARSEEQLEFLAQLYEKGGDQRRAAHCYLAGGDKALKRYANDQAVELYTKALGMLGDDDAVARLDALHNLGSVLDLVGRVEEAQAKFEHMLQRAWLFDHKSKGGAAHGRLARIHRRRGEYEKAMEHLRAANDLFTKADDQRGIAGGLDDIGKIHWHRGSYGQALDYHRKALTIRRALGDQRSIALSLANIGRVHNDSGAFKAANRQFREALDLRRDIGDMSGVVQSLCDIGGVHTADAAYVLALEMFAEAQKIAVDIGDKLAETDVLLRLGECKSSMGRGPDGVEHLMEAASLAVQLGNRRAQSEAARRLAEVYISMGDSEQALDFAKRAMQISLDIGSRAQVGVAHRVIADAICAAGYSPEQVALAAEHYDHAVQILAGMKNELELARCYRTYAMFCERTNKPLDAAKLRRRADEIFGRLRGAVSLD